MQGGERVWRMRASLISGQASLDKDHLTLSALPVRAGATLEWRERLYSRFLDLSARLV